MTSYTPRIPIFFDKGHFRIEGISALCAEEVPHVPLRAASNDDFALDWGFAALTSRGEEFVEIEMAVEAEAGVAVGGFHAVEVVLSGAFGDGHRNAVLASVDSILAGVALFFGLGVEGDAFEVGVAFVADETSRVEAFAGCGQDAAGDWESAVSA